MKNKIISIFTSLTIIAGVLIPCFTFVSADEGGKNLTHKTAVIQNFESYGSFDEFKDFINNSNYTDVGFKAQNGGKAHPQTCACGGGRAVPGIGWDVSQNVPRRIYQGKAAVRQHIRQNV